MNPAGSSRSTWGAAAPLFISIDSREMPLKLNSLLLSLTLSTALTTPAMAAPAHYTIDGSHTFPVFEVDHLGFSTQRGRFNRTSGTVVLDTTARSGSVDVSIDAGSIDMGFAKWNENMRGEGYFHTEAHPAIRFVAGQIRFEGENPVAAIGQLTLLGVTRPLTLTFERFRCAPHPMHKRETCGADLRGSLKRSDFGMTKSLPSVGDEIRLHVPVEAYRTPE